MKFSLKTPCSSCWGCKWLPSAGRLLTGNWPHPTQGRVHGKGHRDSLWFTSSYFSYYFQLILTICSMLWVYVKPLWYKADFSWPLIYNYGNYTLSLTSAISGGMVMVYTGPQPYFVITWTLPRQTHSSLPAPLNFWLMFCLYEALLWTQRLIHDASVRMSFAHSHWGLVLLQTTLQG